MPKTEESPKPEEVVVKPKASAKRKLVLTKGEYYEKLFRGGK